MSNVHSRDTGKSHLHKDAIIHNMQEKMRLAVLSGAICVIIALCCIPIEYGWVGPPNTFSMWIPTILGYPDGLLYAVFMYYGFASIGTELRRPLLATFSYASAWFEIVAAVVALSVLLLSPFLFAAGLGVIYSLTASTLTLIRSGLNVAEGGAILGLQRDFGSLAVWTGVARMVTGIFEPFRMGNIPDVIFLVLGTMMLVVYLTRRSGYIGAARTSLG